MNHRLSQSECVYIVYTPFIDSSSDRWQRMLKYIQPRTPNSCVVCSFVANRIAIVKSISTVIYVSINNSMTGQRKTTKQVLNESLRIRLKAILFPRWKSVRFHQCAKNVEGTLFYKIEGNERADWFSKQNESALNSYRKLSFLHHALVPFSASINLLSCNCIPEQHGRCLGNTEHLKKKTTSALSNPHRRVITPKSVRISNSLVLFFFSFFFPFSHYLS